MRSAHAHAQEQPVVSHSLQSGYGDLRAPPTQDLFRSKPVEPVDLFRVKPAEAAVVEQDQGQAFIALYPKMAQDVMDEVQQLGLPVNSTQWIARAFEFSIWGGKMSRGKMVPQMALALGAHSEVQLHQARIVGWCLEVLQAAFLVVDDVCDQAETRRGKPAYYKLPEVGPGRAVNDGLLLESFVFRLLRRHLREHPAYVDLIELFRESIFVTECGQLMDLNAPPQSITDVEERFTLEHYRKMVACKTSHYTFYLPVACSLFLTGKATTASLAEARAVCDSIGEFFQVQDDILGCWGDEVTTGKGNNDVAERKCTWLAVTALQKCRNPAQTLALQQGLIAADTEAVTEIYEDLMMREAFLDHAADSVGAIREQLASADLLGGVRPVLEAVLNKMHGRVR